MPRTKKPSLTATEYSDIFHKAHKDGAARHRVAWLLANEAAVDALVRMKEDYSDTRMKAISSAIVLHVLDRLRTQGFY